MLRTAYNLQYIEIRSVASNSMIIRMYYMLQCFKSICECREIVVNGDHFFGVKLLIKAHECQDGGGGVYGGFGVGGAE